MHASYMTPNYFIFKSRLEINKQNSLEELYMLQNRYVEPGAPGWTWFTDILIYGEMIVPYKAKREDTM